MVNFVPSFPNKTLLITNGPHIYPTAPPIDHFYVKLSKFYKNSYAKPLLVVSSVCACLSYSVSLPFLLVPSCLRSARCLSRISVVCVVLSVCLCVSVRCLFFPFLSSVCLLVSSVSPLLPLSVLSFVLSRVSFSFSFLCLSSFLSLVVSLCFSVRFSVCRFCSCPPPAAYL